MFSEWGEELIKLVVPGIPPNHRVRFYPLRCFKDVFAVAFVFFLLNYRLSVYFSCSFWYRLIFLAQFFTAAYTLRFMLDLVDLLQTLETSSHVFVFHRALWKSSTPGGGQRASPCLLKTVCFAFFVAFVGFSLCSPIMAILKIINKACCRVYMCFKNACGRSPAKSCEEAWPEPSVFVNPCRRTTTRGKGKRRRKSRFGRKRKPNKCQPRSACDEVCDDDDDDDDDGGPVLAIWPDIRCAPMALKVKESGSLEVVEPDEEDKCTRSGRNYS